MQELEQIAEKRFRVDCSRIVLIRNGANPLRLEGPGVLYQDANGRLQFELRPDANSYRALLNDYSRGVTVGQVIPQSEYFEIGALETGGGEPWLGSVACVETRGGLFQGGTVSGSPDGLSRDYVPGKADSEHDYATLYIEGPFPFPKDAKTTTEVRRGERLVLQRLNWDHTTIRIAAEEFSLTDCGSYALLECTLDVGGIGRYRHVRMLEALQFALGQVMHPSALFLNSKEGRRATIRSFARPGQKGSGVQPPLLFSNKPGPSAVSGLVDAYYRATQDWNEADWHPVSRRVYQLIQAGGSPREVTALAYSVATEGVVGDCFPALGKPSADFVADLDKLTAALPDLKLSVATVSRLAGAIGAMKSVRSSDRLRVFIAQYHLPETMLEAWKKTRNTSAHGGESAAEAQALLSDLHQILHLFYSVVLTFIGYAGPRTDYLTLGHPQQSWPLSSSNEIQR